MRTDLETEKVIEECLFYASSPGETAVGGAVQQTGGAELGAERKA